MKEEGQGTPLSIPQSQIHNKLNLSHGAFFVKVCPIHTFTHTTQHSQQRQPARRAPPWHLHTSTKPRKSPNHHPFQEGWLQL